MELARGRGIEEVRSLKVEINTYIFHELNIGQGEEEVSECWPFRLREVRGIGSGRRGIRVFRFSDGNNEYFVETGRSFSFWEVDGMSIEDLRLHMLAEEWLQRQEVIDLDAARTGDPRVPSIADQRTAIEEMALHTVGLVEHIQVLEGLFFPLQNRYLALVENSNTGCTFLIGSGIPAYRVEYPEVAPWRRLYIGVGELLRNGQLP